MILKALITDNADPVLAESLEQAGIACAIRTNLDYNSLLAYANGYDALVVRSKIIIDRNFIDHCPRLRCIGRVGAGMETIDVEYARSKGIACLNSPEGNRDAVGEHALGLLLALMNKIAFSDQEVRQGLWRREANRGWEIKGKTMGIIGMGNMGGSFAKRLQGFDCKILAYDILGRNASGFQLAPWAECADIAALKDCCDIVSLHVPLSPETKHLADYAFFQSFKKPIWLINTSRGGVVNTPDLAKAMQEGKIIGAGLDVMEYEDMTKDGLDISIMPEDFKYLLQAPNTVLTPHVAGWTAESKYKLAKTLAEKIIQTLQSTPSC